MIALLGLEKINVRHQQSQVDVFCFLKEKYLGKMRLSGEPGYYHPFRMMKEMIDAGVEDSKIILGALLHDILEDTDISYKQFEHIFGHDIFEIVYGLSNLDSKKEKMRKPDYFSKFRSSIHVEWRILFIKIFDCLDNLRTLEELPQERQIRFRQEKKNFYLEIFKEKTPLIPQNLRNIFLRKIGELSTILECHEIFL